MGRAEYSRQKGGGIPLAAVYTWVGSFADQGHQAGPTWPGSIPPRVTTHALLL